MANLLLIDDDDAALAWMSAALESRGHQVQRCHRAREALDALDRHRPDLIVADVLMPEMDGIAFARLARKHRHVPLMFVSIATRQAEAVLAGAVGYVQKPATAAELRAAVERVLGESSRRNTILVVDDETDVRSLYRDFLEPRFDVLTAANGKEALSVLRANRVVLAVVDVHMPVMNGVELVRAMRQEPALERIPVVVQSTDRVALDAPVWGTLRVARTMDKVGFVDWIEEQMDAPS